MQKKYKAQQEDPATDVAKDDGGDIIPILRSNQAAKIYNKGLKRQAAARATHDEDSTTDVSVDNGQGKLFFSFLSMSLTISIFP